MLAVVHVSSASMSTAREAQCSEVMVRMSSAIRQISNDEISFCGPQENEAKAEARGQVPSAEARAKSE